MLHVQCTVCIAEGYSSCYTSITNPKAGEIKRCSLRPDSKGGSDSAAYDECNRARSLGAGGGGIGLDLLALLLQLRRHERGVDAVTPG